MELLLLPPAGSTTHRRQAAARCRSGGGTWTPSRRPASAAPPTSAVPRQAGPPRDVLDPGRRRAVPRPGPPELDGTSAAPWVPSPRPAHHDACGAPPRRTWSPEPAPRLAAAPPRRRRGSLAAVVALNAVTGTAVLGFVAVAVGPQTGAYRTLTMLSDSMAPQYPSGSVVLVTPEPVSSLRAGQVITFHAPTPERPVVTHRVVDVDRTGPRPVITTKGDANDDVDPWRAVLGDDVVWRAQAAVPFAGRAIAALRGQAARTALVQVLPAVLLGWLLVGVWRPRADA